MSELIPSSFYCLSSPKGKCNQCHFVHYALTLSHISMFYIQEGSDDQIVYYLLIYYKLCRIECAQVSGMKMNSHDAICPSFHLCLHYCAQK